MAKPRILPGDPNTQSEFGASSAATEHDGPSEVSAPLRLFRRLFGKDSAGNDRARELRQALRTQDYDTAKSLLAGGVGVYEDQEASLACIVARRKNLALLDLLIRAGADINQADRRGKSDKSRTPLMEAARQGWEEGVDALLAAKAKTELADEAGTTALHLAVRVGRQAIVEQLLAAGASPMPPSSHRPCLTALHEAADVAVVDRLLTAGAEPNAIDKNGMTPLHYQARAGRAEIVERLLRAGGDPNHKEKNGRTPVFMIGQKGDAVASLDRLLIAGAQLHLIDTDENNYAHLVCARADNKDLFRHMRNVSPEVFTKQNHVSETPDAILAIRGFKDLVPVTASNREERLIRGEFVEPAAQSLFKKP